MIGLSKNQIEKIELISSSENVCLTAILRKVVIEREYSEDVLIAVSSFNVSTQHASPSVYLPLVNNLKLLKIDPNGKHAHLYGYLSSICALITMMGPDVYVRTGIDTVEQYESDKNLGIIKVFSAQEIMDLSFGYIEPKAIEEINHDDVPF